MAVSEKQSERRRAILKAARAVFIARGYHEASLDDIIREVGGSRRNIYQLFGDKAGLFEAVMHDLTQDILSRFDQLPAEDASPRAWLEALGTLFLSSMLERDVIDTFRQFIATSSSRPAIGRSVYEKGPAVLHQQLARYLTQQTAIGHLRVKHPASAARIFVEMIKGDFQLRALLTGESPLNAAGIRKHVREAVDIFLNGVANLR